MEGETIPVERLKVETLARNDWKLYAGTVETLLRNRWKLSSGLRI